MSLRVLFIFTPQPELIEFFKKGLSNHTDIELIIPDDLEEETLLSHAGDVEVIIGWRPSEKLVKAAKNLKLVINPGAGVQHHFSGLSALYAEKDIALTNCHGNAFFTAEHTVAMLTTIVNQIIPHHQWMKEGQWRLGDKEAKSTTLQGKQIGLLGFGEINSLVYRFLLPYDAQFFILRNSEWTAEERNMDKVTGYFSKDDLHAFLSQIDILIIAVPATPQTDNLIGQKELVLLGESGILINIARGSVVQQEALYNALKDKTIQAAGIDVWYDYKVEEDESGRKFPYTQPFYKLDNVLLSPHRAASPYDDINRWTSVVENLIEYKLGKPLQNRVDFLRQY